MEKVLLVDDEPLIINSLKRGLAGSYEFLSATSGKEGLLLLKSSSSVAIIVSDMSMPEMTGSEFLKEASRFAPDAIRVMLTGLADQKTAIKAINDGSVYKFLTKPCSVSDFENTLKECIAKKHLLQQEKDLLQNTLGGVINLITDLLSFIDPDGIQRAANMRKIVRELSKSVHFGGVEVELAAMLSGIGKFSLPLELLVKTSNQEVTTEKESALLAQSVNVSARLLKQIPKLEKVSQILESLRAPENNLKNPIRSSVIAYRVAEKINNAIGDSEATVSALNRIVDQLTKEERELFSTLLSGNLKNAVSSEGGRYEVLFADLCPGQKLVEDITDQNGKLLLKKGFLISDAVIERIKNHHELVGVKIPFFVNERIPTKS